MVEAIEQVIYWKERSDWLSYLRRVFSESGCCEVPPPPVVAPCSAASALFSKAPGSATGSVGVLTYDLYNADLNDQSHLVAVMYSVPFDRVLYSNWFAVGIFDRDTNCDYNLYDVMYNGSEDRFIRAKADGSCISYNNGYIAVSASMSDSCEAVLRMDIDERKLFF